VLFSRNAQLYLNIIKRIIIIVFTEIDKNRQKSVRLVKKWVKYRSKAKIVG
jgi:hypothetical protein